MSGYSPVPPWARVSDPWQHPGAKPEDFLLGRRAPRPEPESGSARAMFPLPMRVEPPVPEPGSRWRRRAPFAVLAAVALLVGVGAVIWVTNRP